MTKEYEIDYTPEFPFILYAATEVSTNPRTPVFRRSNYDVCTVEYIREGSGTLNINGKTFHPQKDGIYFLTPGSTHEYYPDRETPWYKLFFVVGGTFAEYLLRLYQMMDVYSIPDCPELKHFFAEMKSVNFYSDQSNRQAALVFHHFLAESSRIAHGRRTETAPDEIDLLKQTLDRSLESSFNLKQYAAERGFSEAHLIRQFRRKNQSITPCVYLLERKMEQARRYLSYSNLSIKEIADRLAFSDQYYFSNYFKKRNGMSPRQYQTRFLGKGKKRENNSEPL